MSLRTVTQHPSDFDHHLSHVLSGVQVVTSLPRLGERENAVN